MKQLVKPLIEPIAEDALEDPVSHVFLDHTVAVKQMNLFSLDRRLEMVKMYAKAHRVLQERSQGEVVVAGEIVDFYPRFHQTGQPRNDCNIVRPYCMPVFDPEIEKIAHD